MCMIIIQVQVWGIIQASLHAALGRCMSNNNIYAQPFKIRCIEQQMHQHIKYNSAYLPIDSDLSPKGLVNLAVVDFMWYNTGLHDVSFVWRWEIS